MTTETQSAPWEETAGWRAFAQETLAFLGRWLVQLQRRPTTLVAGVLQPLMWLLLFGALFRNLPPDLLDAGQSYVQFLAAGIVVFTAFSGALNAGLPMMFDREFGFLNRMLVAPLVSRFSIVLAAALFIALLSLVQTAAITLAAVGLGAPLPSLAGLGAIALVVTILVLGFATVSLGFAFALPGHQELLAVIFLINLPLLFSSTALAPLKFMPGWLQWVASCNPLTWAIEPIRYAYSHETWALTATVLRAPWGDLSFGGAVLGLLLFALGGALAIRATLQRGMA
ncbi:MAG: ABC transporter permease [Oscillatoriales cyanobacterium SM2_1_8]|nr:ABC transporter permease [Oscillatoriales cyanobacterium SM2_1_8]